MRVAIDVQVEQALARGCTTEQIVTDLGVRVSYVVAIRARMDAINQIDDVAGKGRKPCGTYAAYKRHVRHGEDIDTACRRANARSVTRSTKQRRGQGAA